MQVHYTDAAAGASTDHRQLLPDGAKFTICLAILTQY